MNGKECRITAYDVPDEYEDTVLMFLDKELASFAPAPAKDDQTAELDAIVVSNLLKQVMLEADEAAVAAPSKTIVGVFDGAASPADFAGSAGVAGIPPKSVVVTPFPGPKSSVAKAPRKPAAVGGDATGAGNASALPELAQSGNNSSGQKDVSAEGRQTVLVKVPNFGAVTVSPGRRVSMIVVAVACFLILVGIVAGCHNF
jgi:hypothetical protein